MKVQCDFRLMTEEDFRSWLNNRPEMQQHHFEGYCTITENPVEYGPHQVSLHNCTNCYPESHFIMVPIELLNDGCH